MRRIDFLADKKQVETLESFGGTLSEHIRRALDEYIQKVKQSKLGVSASTSKKEGDTNG